MIRAMKRRSFTTELLIWFVLLIALPVAALLVYFYVHSLSELKQAAQEKMLVLNRSAQRSIDFLGETITGVTITNGFWETNRQALLSRDMQWLHDNIGDMPNIVPNIDFAAEADMNGSIVVQTGDVAELSGRVGFPVIMERIRNEKSFTGILNTSRGLAIVAVSEVTDEAGDKPPAGVLVTGRLITDAMLLRLKDILQADVAIKLKSGQYIASNGSVEDGKLEGELGNADTRGEWFELDRGSAMFVAHAAAPLLDMNGEKIGIIHTNAPTEWGTQAASNLRTIIISVAGIMVLLLGLVIYLLRRRILLPLRHFTLSLGEIAAGRQVRHMPEHMLHAEARIVQAVQQIMQWNRLLEQTVERRTAEIRNLLDQTGQGFLTVGSNLTVRGEYSRECIRLLGREPAGCDIGILFCPDDVEERELLLSILTDYFDQRDEGKKELIFSLLPEELRIGGRIVKAEYKPFAAAGGAGDLSPGGDPEEAVMIMLTDMSDTRRLEDQMQRERSILRMVVQTVTNPEDYLRIAAEYERFHRSGWREIVEGGRTPRGKAEAILRLVHTFKGSFGFLRFLSIVPRLHELENGLQTMLQRKAGPVLSELVEYMERHELAAWLEEDREQLRSVLGAAHDDLLQERGIVIDRGRWLAMESRLERAHAAGEDADWLQELRSWRCRPVRTMLEPHADYLAELASNSGLLLHPVKIAGGDIPIDPERLAGFALAFVHIVRNIVMHGIEPPAERSAAGKDECGSVAFAAERTGNGLRITVEDDGRGIDPARIRERAARQGRQLEGLPEEELLPLIFEDSYTTALAITELGGRGVGLSAVKEAVEGIGGSIGVISRVRAGTSFIFLIPDEPAEAEAQAVTEKEPA